MTEQKKIARVKRNFIKGPKSEKSRYLNMKMGYYLLINTFFLKFMIILE